MMQWDRGAVSDVDAYIMQFDSEIQCRLRIIRAAGLAVFRNASETIYHRLPTFMVDGKDVLNYGAFKSHITLYIGYELAYLFKNQYPQYQYGKASMQIPHEVPFPEALIREICELLHHIS